MNIESLWETFHGPLKNFLLKRTADEHAVEDILQMVFIKIHKHVEDLHDEQKLRSWIYQITRNTLADYYRKNKKMESLSDSLTDMQDKNEEEVTRELAECIRPMVQKLPNIYREAVELSELEGYTQKELSEQLGISYSGAKSRVQRGREKLKEMLLVCCHFQFDRFGHIIDYEAKNEESSTTDPVNKSTSCCDS